MSGIERARQIAAEMGIELLPWQDEWLRAVLSGEQITLARGRRCGWTTVQNIAWKVASEADE